MVTAGPVGVGVAVGDGIMVAVGTGSGVAVGTGVLVAVGSRVGTDVAVVVGATVGSVVAVIATSAVVISTLWLAATSDDEIPCTGDCRSSGWLQAIHSISDVRARIAATCPIIALSKVHKSRAVSPALAALGLERACERMACQVLTHGIA